MKRKEVCNSFPPIYRADKGGPPPSILQMNERFGRVSRVSSSPCYVLFSGVLVYYYIRLGFHIPDHSFSLLCLALSRLERTSY